MVLELLDVLEDVLVENSMICKHLSDKRLRVRLSFKGISLILVVHDTDGAISKTFTCGNFIKKRRDLIIAACSDPDKLISWKAVSDFLPSSTALRMVGKDTGEELDASDVEWFSERLFEFNTDLSIVDNALLGPFGARIGQTQTHCKCP